MVDPRATTIALNVLILADWGLSNKTGFTPIH
jgi:hypothetical protein